MERYCYCYLHTFNINIIWEFLHDSTMSESRVENVSLFRLGKNLFHLFWSELEFVCGCMRMNIQFLAFNQSTVQVEDWWKYQIEVLLNWSTSEFRMWNCGVWVLKLSELLVNAFVNTRKEKEIHWFSTELKIQNNACQEIYDYGIHLLKSGSDLSSSGLKQMSSMVIRESRIQVNKSHDRMKWRGWNNQ